MLPDKPFLIIGHRGAAGLEPENTLRSFRRAVALGVDAVELDVHRVNGELLVIHDDTLERTTNGRDLIANHSLEELRTLDAGGGEKIPTLAEVFQELPPACAVNVELKGLDTAGLVADFLAVHTSHPVLVSSFRHDELAAFQSRSPASPVAPLYGRRAPDLNVLPVNAPWSINISRRVASADLIGGIRRAGYRCLVYTVNDPGEAHNLRALGASGVFTDFPDRVRA